MAAIWSAPPQGLLRDAVLFDVYRPRSRQTMVGLLLPRIPRKKPGGALDAQ
jgi:hypothetical protein